MAHITLLLGSTALTEDQSPKPSLISQVSDSIRRPPESFNKAILTNQQTLGKSLKKTKSKLIRKIH